MQVRAKDLTLLPNLMSLSRIVLIFIPAYLISTQRPELRIWALILVLVGILSDILDGVIARRFNMASDLGRILDPLADKICTGILVVTLYLYADFPLWGVLLIVARDISVLLFSLMAIRKTAFILPSNMIGKFAALSWGLAIAIYIIDFSVLKTPILAIAVILLIASAVSYLRQFNSHLRRSGSL
ncbi:MAG: CDP-alcohol phosphatidyltransferase family protein [candidate division Zixibacteria bacterium]|nr:CDP-alcohol phosphatidyltransferase family protein [candidate division Zixibacteria bacterium]